MAVVARIVNVLNAPESYSLKLKKFKFYYFTLKTLKIQDVINNVKENNKTHKQRQGT